MALFSKYCKQSTPINVRFLAIIIRSRFRRHQRGDTGSPGTDPGCKSDECPDFSVLTFLGCDPLITWKIIDQIDQLDPVLDFEFLIDM